MKLDILYASIYVDTNNVKWDILQNNPGNLCQTCRNLLFYSLSFLFDSMRLIVAVYETEN